MTKRSAVLLLLSFCVVVWTASPSTASEVGSPRAFGWGVLLGVPSGCTGKVFFDREHALDFGVGIGWLSGANLHVHADYVFHIPLVRTRYYVLPIYVGVGGRFTFWFEEGKHGYWGRESREAHRFGVAVRVPVGVAFHLNIAPLDPFVEVVPGLGVFPGVGFTLGGGIGIRYYF